MRHKTNLKGEKGKKIDKEQKNIVDIVEIR